MTTETNWRPRPAIAVLGGSLRYTERQLRAGFVVGRELARCGKTLVTGATSGVPYAAALGAHSAGGLVVGISAATCADDHLKLGKPLGQADVLIFTGMGAEGRSPLILRSVAGAIFVGGEFGTMGEFCSGWLAGVRVLGVLEGSGGLSDSIRSLVQGVSSSWGSQVVYVADPARLTAEVCSEIDSISGANRVPEPCEDVRNALANLLTVDHATR